MIRFVDLCVQYRNGEDRVFSMAQADAEYAIELTKELLCSPDVVENFVCVDTSDGVCILKLDELAGLRVCR